MGDVIKFQPKDPLDKIRNREQAELHERYTALLGECEELISGTLTTEETKPYIESLINFESGLEIKRDSGSANNEHLEEMEEYFDKIKKQLKEII